MSSHSSLECHQKWQTTFTSTFLCVDVSTVDLQLVSLSTKTHKQQKQQLFCFMAVVTIAALWSAVGTKQDRLLNVTMYSEQGASGAPLFIVAHGPWMCQSGHDRVIVYCELLPLILRGHPCPIASVITTIITASFPAICLYIKPSFNLHKPVTCTISPRGLCQPPRACARPVDQSGELQWQHTCSAPVSPGVQSVLECFPDEWQYVAWCNIHFVCLPI